MATNRLGNVARGFLPRNRFARSVSVLAGGTVAGQIIVVAASPALTRLYTPEDFGLLAVYAGLLGILGVVASLRYQLAIPLPESDEEATSILVLSLLVVLGITALSSVLVGLFGTPIVRVLNTPKLEPYLWLLPLGLLLMGVYQVFLYWAVRTKAFPAIARTKLTQALGMVGVQIGAYALGPVALLAGQVGGQAAGTSTLGALTLRKRWRAIRQVRLADIAWAANRYRRFALFSSWDGFLNNAGRQLPAVLLAAFFSPAAAGTYMLTDRVLRTPMQLIGQSISNVFYSNAADAYRENRLAPLVANIHEQLAHIAMPLALILLLAGPDLFELFFGYDWRQAGDFAQVMAPWIYLMFVISPLTGLFLVMEEQILSLKLNVLMFLVRISSLLFGSFVGDLMVTIIIFSIASALCNLCILVWIMRISGNSWRQAWMPSASAFGWGVLQVTPLVFSYAFFEMQPLWIVGLIISGLLVAVRYNFMLKNYGE